MRAVRAKTKPSTGTHEWECPEPAALALRALLFLPPVPLNPRETGASTRRAHQQPLFGAEFGPGGDIYFCDTGNHAIRKVDRETGVITTVAGTGGGGGYTGRRGGGAKLFEPYELRFDADGNLFFSR